MDEKYRFHHFCLKVTPPEIKLQALLLTYFISIETRDLVVGWGSYAGSVREGMHFSQTKNALLLNFVVVYFHRCVAPPAVVVDFCCSGARPF